jgi:hypothetical protein
MLPKAAIHAEFVTPHNFLTSDFITYAEFATPPYKEKSTLSREHHKIHFLV